MQHGGGIGGLAISLCWFKPDFLSSAYCGFIQAVTEALNYP
jgi:hypothetical protein